MSERPREPTLAARVRELTGVSWAKARDLCESGRVKVDGVVADDPSARLLPTMDVVVDERAPRRRLGVLEPDRLLYFDRDVVVVDKPAGVLTLPYEPGDRDTLVDQARALVRRKSPKGFDPELAVVHRLDKDTTGVLVFGRNLDAKRALSTLFRTHDVVREYVAIAHGRVHAARIESHLVTDRGDGLRGSHGVFRRASGGPPPEAKRAVTYVEPLRALRGSTLVRCRLETGRQHQIRIHLAEAGHPLVGERVYVRDYAAPRIESDRPMLHARVLGFAHPRSLEPMRFERDPPEDFEAMLAALTVGQGP